MHTVQLLFVEANTHQEAVEIVDSKINDWEGHWSDWHAIGGRWSGIFGENHPDVINYYSLKCMVKVLAGDWTYDSCFFDLEAYSETLVPFRERVATRPEKQFVVAVDFHF